LGFKYLCNLRLERKKVPLSFKSTNRGSIAFGFFNIDSDMLLLERYFLFATEWCDHLKAIARMKPLESFEVSWPVYIFENRADIGDLMGAIHGIRHLGFIGRIYLEFPFPSRPEDFKQKTEGEQTQSQVEEIICEYVSRRTEIEIVGDMDAEEISIGDYRFTKKRFGELIQYVWKGGYPRWREEIRPDCVREMYETLSTSGHWLYKGLALAADAD
jgi:hypothetical protein